MIDGTKFNWLPAEIINHVILPYLEWDDRINLNRFLPAGDRLKRTGYLKATKVRQIVEDCALGVYSSKRLHAVQESADLCMRAAKIIKIIESANNPFVLMLLKNYPKFQNTFLGRLNYFREESNLVIIPCRTLAKELVDACNKAEKLVLSV
jgi:hypothetical protein